MEAGPGAAFEVLLLRSCSYLCEVLSFLWLMLCLNSLECSFALFHPAAQSGSLRLAIRFPFHFRTECQHFVTDFVTGRFLGFRSDDCNRVLAIFREVAPVDKERAFVSDY